MVRNTSFDPLNNQKTRNIKNSNRYNYNCGGYALETFSWYCPHTKQDDRLHDGFFTAGANRFNFRNRIRHFKQSAAAFK